MEKHKKTTNINRLEDKYYTKQEIANRCFDIILRYIDVSKTTHWIEPSVGIGAFENAFKKSNLGELHNITTIDIDPGVTTHTCIDFLS